MQKTVYLITLLLSFNSCLESAVKMEQESMKCFSDVSANHNINLDSIIAAIELHLISENQLNGTQSSDYILFLERMESENKTSHLSEYPSTTTLLYLHNLPIFQGCKIRFKNEAYSGSTSQKLDNALAQLVIRMDISPKSFSNAFLNSLPASDFIKPYYKVLFWKIYADLFISGPTPSELLPLKAVKEEVTFDSNYPTATIKIKGSDILEWNGQQLTIENLKDSVTNLIKGSIKNSFKTIEIENIGTENISDYLLYLKTESSTKYGFYIQIQNIIFGCINDLRNETAQRIYKQEYFSLDKEKKKRIESIVKKSIK